MSSSERRTARQPKILSGRRRRIPFVRQATFSDCGAASLTMVLRFLGKEVGLEEVREATGFGREGVDALGLVQSARSFGLRGRGLRIDRLEDLELLPAGTILHWRFNHFLVLERVQGDEVDVVDPAAGPRRVGRRELDRDFTGVAIVFEPTSEFEPQRGKGRSKVLRRYLLKFLAHSGLLWKILVTSTMVHLFALSVPLLIGVLVDRVVPAGEASLLPVLTGGLAMLVGFSFAASLIRRHLLLHFQTRLDAQLTLDFLDHLVELPFPFFQQRSAGDLMMRMNSNATIREILTSGALSTILDGVLVLFYLVLLSVASIELAAVVVVLGLVRVLIFLAARRRHRRLMSEMLHTQAISQGYQVQLLSGIGTLKSLGVERRAVDHWSNLFTDVLNVSLSRGRLSAWVDALLEALAVASPLAILLCGAALVFRGEISLGTMLATNALAVGFLGPLSKLVTTAFQLQLLGSYMERIEDVLETPKEQPGGQVRAAPRLSGAIRLDGVSFRYAPSSPPAVRDVSLEIEPGQLVALVGASGAGKSTLANLLLGLYTPDEGDISFDGINLRELDFRSVREQVGVVEQHPFLFGQSIRANIALAAPGADFAQVVEAAKRAHIHDEIAALAMGYDTILADGGGSLSGGQRQRIALARALVRRPAILLLDEATSNLDAVAESRIHGELDRLSSTRIVIAHRLSTVVGADLILVMEEGRVVERGTHGELLARGGRYHRLVEKQVQTSGAAAP